MASIDDSLVSLAATQVTLNWHTYYYSVYNITHHDCRSSGAYELLRDSGCIRLPTQRTLRDYTHYVKASTGFSSDVDTMLINAAKVKTCPERDKCVMLLIDEMHIRQDLVFDKHTGELIGYANLGDINNHLIDFEQSLASTSPEPPKFAKTMLVFMVRGLFSKLQFAYAQFPAASLSGDLIYDPFWEAVDRVERCELKVSSLITEQERSLLWCLY